MSRTSPSASASSSSLPRVHGHDHSRPLPPPRLLEGGGGSLLGNGPVTVPLTALTTSASFRSSSARSNNVAADAGLLGNSPTTTAAATTTAGSEVTLAVPRPDGERVVNEYVETPFRHQSSRDTSNPGPEDKCPKCPKKSERRAQQRLLLPLHKSRLLLHRQQQQQQQQSHHHALLLQASSPLGGGAPITKQPVSFTKQPSGGQQPHWQGGTPQSRRRGAGPAEAASLSIMCEHCGRCRCESCREPPPLPSRWLCDNACFCSAETALDYASCLCCAKGLFYHCADGSGGVDGNEEGASCADEPCSCTGNRRAARWACLGALTLILPCLLCYWPLKGCVTVCEACYARYAAQGCRCEPSSSSSAHHHHHHHHHHNHHHHQNSALDPEKRLLDTPEL